MKRVLIRSDDIIINCVKLLILTIGLIFAQLNCFGNTGKSDTKVGNQENAVLLSIEENNFWISYYNYDSTRIGFKDKNGIIKTTPKFGDPVEIANVNPCKFDDVIIVGEKFDKKWDAYYLTKAGKIFGRDSIFIFDFIKDCESEGFIRFMSKDPEHKNVIGAYKYIGMFNRNGDVVIPAKYVYLTRVQNGMILALNGAKKCCLRYRYDYEEGYDDCEEKDNCEYHEWVGGQWILMDTSGNILGDGFHFDKPFNLFSIQKTAIPHPDTIRESFLARDNNYYSFINFKKEFILWLTNDLLANLTAEKLTSASFDIMFYGEPANTNKINDKKQFIVNNFEPLKNGLLAMFNHDNKYSISVEKLNNDIYKRELSEKYYNNCGEYKTWVYPVMRIIINRKDEISIENAAFYDFLRIDNNVYKFISVGGNMNCKLNW